MEKNIGVSLYVVFAGMDVNSLRYTALYYIIFLYMGSHLLVAATQEFQCTRCFDNLYEVYNFFFQVGLSILILLHLYWFSLLMRIGYSYFVKNEYHDYSEHKSGEKQLLDDKKNGKIKHT